MCIFFNKKKSLMSALFAPLIVMIYLVVLLFTLKTSFSYAVLNEDKKGFDAISSHCILRNIISFLPALEILNVVKLKKSPESIDCAISVCSDIPLIIKGKKISDDCFSSKNNNYGCYSQIKKLKIVNSTFNLKMLEQIPETLTELSIDSIEYPLGTNAREFNEKLINTIVKKFKNLEKLDLRNCSIIITPQMIQALSKMPKLTHLNLSRNEIDAEEAGEIFKISNLVSLDLSENNINYLRNEAFSKMKNLTHLNLARNNIHFFGDQYSSEKPSITHLNLSENNININSIRCLSKLKSITNLDLSKNNIIDNEVVVISEMENLTHLKLSQNKIGDQGVSKLSGMSNLIQLDLSGNEIGDDGAFAISKMTNLTHLNISKNRIGNKGAQALSDRNVLWMDLNLSGNRSGPMYTLMKYFSFLFDCIECINY